MTLFTCGICSSDTALIDCKLLADFKKEIDASDIKAMFVEMILPLNDVNATKYERNFAIAVESELVDGILKNSVYACHSCVRQLQVFYKQTQKESQSELLAALAVASIGEGQTAAASLLFESEPLECIDDDSDDEIDPVLDEPVYVKRKVPAKALVNGHFRGQTPACLTGLTRVEMSMVARINCVYSVSMLKGGCHWGSTATIFSVLNDVNAIAHILPRIPCETDWAIIRSAVDSASPKEFTYIPFKVVKALLWLEENNPHWEGAFQRPAGSEWEGIGSSTRQDAPVISASAEDYGYLESEGVERDDGNAVNPGAPTSTTNVLLVPSDTDVDLESQIGSILQSTR